MINKEDALTMYKRGCTLQEIGNKYNVSRQRISQIIEVTQTSRHIRNNLKKHPNKSELWLAKTLQEHGYSVKFTTYNNSYDLLVNDFLRIEAKHRVKASIKSKQNKAYVHVGSINSKKFDFLILMIGDLYQNPAIYIIPSSKCPQNLSLPMLPKKNTRYQRLYRDAWSSLT